MRLVTVFFPVIAAAGQIGFESAPKANPVTASSPLPTLFKRATFTEPCEEISASWSALVPEASGSPIRVGAQLAYDCLQSVPVDVDGDLLLIDELKNFMQFQSTLGYVKDEDFQRENDAVVDVMGSLDDIATKVQNGDFASEYEVQLAIKVMTLSVGDFHFNYYPDILTPLYIFRPEAELLQLSTDGSSPGKPYLKTDLEYAAMSNFSWTPSAISQISNDQNATEFLFNVSKYFDFHTADARYNRIFVNQAKLAVDNDREGPFIAPVVYDGPETRFSFENGSTAATIQNLANLNLRFDWSNVTDGQSFFDSFCSGPNRGLFPAPTETKRATQAKTVEGYPQPVAIEATTLQFQGYFLNGSYSDTAVLVTPGFEPDDEQEAQQMFYTFFAAARDQGKKKLVIDLRGNQGGTIAVGFELFKQLFPNEIPYGATRFRAHEAMGKFQETMGTLINDQTLPQDNATLYDEIVKLPGAVAWPGVLNEQNKPFNNFEEFYGPYEHNSDNFTALRRYDFTNNANGYPSSRALNITGYLSNSDAPPQPFDPENIVILSDGFCGSTCAVFAQLMREQGRVQTIFVGGLPRSGPVQAVGGTKGAQVLQYDYLVKLMKATINYTRQLISQSAAEDLENTAVGAIVNTEQLYQRSTHLNEDQVLGGRINSLDNIRQNDSDQVPLEFVYEAADCRIYETWETRRDPTNLWTMAVDVKWGKGKCADGSLDHETAVSVLDEKKFNWQAKEPVNKTEGNTDQPNNSTQEHHSGASAGFAAWSSSLVTIAAFSTAVLML